MTQPGDRAAAARLLPPGGHSVALDRLCALVARVLAGDGPALSSQVSLLTDVQVVAGGAHVPDGYVGSTGPLCDSLCTVTAASRGPLLVTDAPADARVRDLPPVTSGTVGCYLGVPLVRTDGTVVGALCVFGPHRRTWSDDDVAVLDDVAAAAVAQLELQALSAEFRASRLRWDTAVEAAGIGSFDWDLRTDRVVWDPRLQELFGYEPGAAERTLEEAFERIDPRHRAAVDQAIAAAVETRGDYRAEFRVQLPDGRSRWVAARGRALAGPDGTVDQLVGTVHDVTDVRTARDQAVRLLETMRTAFVALDRDWRVTYVNAEATRVVGMQADELLGREIWEAFPGLEDTAFGRAYRRAVETGETVEVEDYYDHLQGWFEVRATPTADGLSLFFLEVTGRHVDKERADAATQRLQLLATVSAELASAGLRTETAVARLARTLVPVLADWCVVSLVQGDQVVDVGTWHADPALRDVVATYSRHRLEGRTDLGAVERVRRTRAPVAIASGLTEQVLPTLGSPPAREALLALGGESVVVLPMAARGALLGIVALVRGPDRPPMSADEVTTATEIGVRAGLALDNARLYGEQLSRALVLQRSLLTTPEQPPHVDAGVKYVPAAEAAAVGGDWYDLFRQSDGATVLAIGDVMGHDIEAAAAMGQVRTLLRGIAWRDAEQPAQVLSALDAAMAGLQVGTTATAVVARLETDGGTGLLRWSGAGHPPPVVLRADGTVEALRDDDPDLLLGIDPGTGRHEQDVVLRAGDTVLLHTDGLVERRGQDIEQGVALLHAELARLAGLPPQELCDALVARLLPGDAEDDAALVAVRLRG